MPKNFKFEIPWTTKYMPKTIEEIICDPTNEKRLKYMIENKLMHNMIITGESGIGKTVTIKVIANSLLKDNYKDAVLELNASEHKGIKIIHKIIKTFCKKKIDENIVHKILLLDEADNLTIKTQQLISSLMEKYSNTRVAFTCNSTSNIIDSIQSHCTILRYTKLDSNKIKKRLLYICEKENIKYDDNGIDLITSNSLGDMRAAINNLQAVYTGFKTITINNINKICDKPNPILIKNIIDYCINNDYANAVKYILQLKNDGYSGSDIIMNMNIVLRTHQMNEGLRIKYIGELGKTCIRISKGLDTNLQLYGCLSRLCLCN